jgi:hypothetical protein
VPAGAGGVGHQAAHAQFNAQVVDPAGQEAGLDDDHSRPLLVEKLAPLRPSRLEAREADFAAGLIVTAGAARDAAGDGHLEIVAASGLDYHLHALMPGSPLPKRPMGRLLAK